MSGWGYIIGISTLASPQRFFNARNLPTRSAWMLTSLVSTSITANIWKLTFSPADSRCSGQSTEILRTKSKTPGNNQGTFLRTVSLGIPYPIIRYFYFAGMIGITLLPRDGDKTLLRAPSAEGQRKVDLKVYFNRNMAKSPCTCLCNFLPSVFLIFFLYIKNFHSIGMSNSLIDSQVVLSSERYLERLTC